MWRFSRNSAAKEFTTLNRLTITSALAGIAVTLVSVAASAQQPPYVPDLLPALASRGTPLAPNFRIGDFRVEELSENYAAPDALPEDAPKTAEEQGFIKRSFKRIGQDQKFLLKGPFEAHNLKWDAVILVGTGAFLAADRHIENNIPHSHFTAYQAISNTALG